MRKVIYLVKKTPLEEVVKKTIFLEGLVPAER